MSAFEISFGSGGAAEETNDATQGVGPTDIDIFALETAVGLWRDEHDDGRVEQLHGSDNLEGGARAEAGTVWETVVAGWKDREDWGVRDPWTSDEHHGREMAYNEWKPISAKIRGLLEAYRLTCNGCHHGRAVRKVNSFLAKAIKKARSPVSMVASLPAIRFKTKHKRSNVGNR